uniref:LRRNT domain-containing protein n=1 Tax=Graphocephala atropunctata TaxID=36148 RepID=A0A1B6M7N2_9HEMI
MKSRFLLSHLHVMAVILLSVAGGMTETVRCPRYCVCYLNTTNYMRSVSCVARRLDNIDLSIPRRVQSLDLSNNSISVLEDRGFQDLGLVEIVELVMRHNSIRTIGLHSFTGLTYLQSVDLTGNNLYQILPWTFHDNSNLKSVSLSGNPLGHIVSPGPFLDIPSLEALELSNCNFAHFPQDAFSALPSLRRLDISRNELISIDIYSLQFLYTLEELDVTKNPWPCNTNLRNLKDYLDGKSGRLVGSSCDLPERLQEIEMKPAKFEKIISVGISYPEYGESTKDDDIVEEATRQNKVECNCIAETKTDFICSDYLGLPPMWSILVSFQLGVCVTLFVGYFWMCCTGQKNKYVCLVPSVPPIIPVISDIQQTMVLNEEEEQPIEHVEGTIPCPDTPPPSYRELFCSSQLLHRQL